MCMRCVAATAAVLTLVGLMVLPKSVPVRNQPPVGIPCCEPTTAATGGYNEAGGKLLAIEQLPAAQPTDQNAKNQNSVGDEKARQEKQLVMDTARIADYTGYLVWVTAGLLTAAIFQFGAFYVQLRYMGRGLKDSGAQHAAANKAFVFIKGFRCVPTSSKANVDDVEFWQILPIIENSGSTPTRRMISFTSAVVRDAELPTEYDFPDIPWGGSVVRLSRDAIGPHSQLNGGPYPISIDDVVAVSKRVKFFYIWGWFDYDDVFQGTQRHRTEFCFQMSVVLNPRSAKNIDAIAMHVHDRHNNTESECLRKPAPYTTTSAHDVPPVAFAP